MIEAACWIAYADETDFPYLSEHDHHISQDLVRRKLRDREIIVAKNAAHKPVGWLRFGYFWDNTPFMNMLFVEDTLRHKGIGARLAQFWENEMKDRGFTLVMTSTQSDEQGQFFYRRHGYRDSGSLLLENEPLEIIFTKSL